jgi:hypothetical protein
VWRFDCIGLQDCSPGGREPQFNKRTKKSIFAGNADRFVMPPIIDLVERGRISLHFIYGKRGMRVISLKGAEILPKFLNISEILP